MAAPLADFLEHASAPMAALGPDGAVRWANRAFRERFPGGAAPSELAPGLLRGVRACLDQGREQVHPLGDGAARFCPAGGPESPVLVEILPGGTDAPDCALALAAARRARREAEDRSLRTRELFFSVIEELPVFVYMQRRDYTVAYANRKTRNLYGDAQGRPCYEVFSGRDTPCPFCPTFRVFDTNRPEEWEFTDGEGRSFRISDYPFEDESGEPLVMEIGIDITELKRIERQLVQAHKMRAIGVLAAGMAHDLNNSLLPIIFNIDYALGREDVAETADPLNEALRAAYRAADLVEQVLQYSRQQDVSRAPLRLTPLVREGLELVRASLPPRVALEEDCAARLDTVSANQAQVQQLIQNLCRNAVQAMPGGGTLSVSLRTLRVDRLASAPCQETGVGDYVTLTVSDTGIGIEQERLEHIFEPFYTTKKGRGGTGMGLAVVHSIVTSMNGVIQVESLPGSGTVFRVHLPVVEPVETRVVAPPRAARASGGRVLVVDDDLGALRAMERALSGAGFRVETARGGREGLESYLKGEGRFDLVLADQAMPDLDGVEMARRILERDPKARVLICTGFASPGLREAIDACGIAGTVHKPMTPRTLVEQVRRHCRPG